MQPPHLFSSGPNLSVNFPLHFSLTSEGLHKTLRYLNPCTWGSNSSLKRVGTPPFSAKNHGLHLGVVILVLAASYSAGNRSSECWRQLPDEAKRPTSPANSKDEIQRSPKWELSATWLCLEILSIKTMNRTVSCNIFHVVKYLSSR